MGAMSDGRPQWHTLTIRFATSGALDLTAEQRAGAKVAANGLLASLGVEEIVALDDMWLITELDATP
jgi:hypothetical protein